ncbi:tetratricopeptide (TPR) repeat protein [Hymenobacter luteus]|uniref:Tetratricopeptide (TPR) repeat protein n=2 Tax=Hymenobacter TaxID=89966 RepID=A0A7W9WDB3_9BACT|nr:MULTISPECIES: tetratricopeptide repeat protein [Hymenobacter]MBB4602489.1 tetratricopeptide (TPR) repeat protein [Hymenobacter latericoloratus]MBB6060380.1 tetratricopeptide (TPR) repeat protein [Hymenobacter luteus]
MTTTSKHQLLILALAVVLVAGLFLLPKVIVKPKEGRGELAQDAAQTATRDGGGPATNGSKAVASSGQQPTTVGPEQPHMTVAPAQRSEINGLLTKYKAINSADLTGRLQLAQQLAAKYKAIEKFDSAGYYFEQVALARPGEQAWKRAADEYFEAYSFAATEERQKLLGAKCQELYEKVLKNNPDNLDAKTNLGMAYMASADPVKGITLIREVLASDPRNEKALYNLGFLAIQSGQFDRAVERFQELIKVNAENVNGQFYLGVALAQTGAKAEARKAFEKAKSLSTDPALAASVDEQLQKLN